MSVMACLVCILRAAGLQEVKEIVKPFDWTFTTKYCGSLTASRQRTFQARVLASMSCFSVHNMCVQQDVVHAMAMVCVAGGGN